MIRKKTAYRLRTVQPWPFHVSLPRNSKWWHLMCVGFIQYSLIFFLSSSLFYARMHISRHCILISNSRVDVRMICVCDRDFCLIRWTWYLYKIFEFIFGIRHILCVLFVCAFSLDLSDGIVRFGCLFDPGILLAFIVHIIIQILFVDEW